MIINELEMFESTLCKRMNRQESYFFHTNNDCVALLFHRHGRFFFLSFIKVDRNFNERRSYVPDALIFSAPAF